MISVSGEEFARMVFRGVFQRIRLYQGRVPGCAWVGERLGAFAGRDLPESECRAIEAHLGECPACAADWEATRGVCDWLAGGVLSARGITSSTEERVSRIMAGIETCEAGRAWKVAEKERAAALRVFRLRPGLAMAGVAVLVLVVVGAGYAVVGGKWKHWGKATSTGGEPPESHQVVGEGAGGGAQSQPGGFEAASRVPETSARSRRDELTELEDELVKEILLDLRVRSALPGTEKEYEEWARKEYPHVMWLYDVLVEEYGYESDWRDMLVRSGEIFRFDWPTTVKEPNCRPRIEGLENAALVAGYEIEFTPEGQHILPLLDWVEEEEEKLVSVFLSLRETSPLEAAPIPIEKVPEGYAKNLCKNRSELQSALVYLIVSSDLSGKVELMSLAGRLRAVLSAFFESASNREPVACPNVGQGNNILLEELEFVINLRHEILLSETGKGLDLAGEM